MNRQPHTQKPRILPLFMAGCAAFTIGIGVTYGYLQWQDQKAQLAQMAQALENIQMANQTDTATRASNLELLSVAPTPSQVPAPVPQPVTQAAAVAEPAPAPTPAPASDAASESTLDALRKIISTASAPKVAPQKTIADEGRFETLAYAIRGVNQLTAAANAGKFILVKPEGAADGTTAQTRLVFPDHADDQGRIEQVLAFAAADGLIPIGSAAQRSDGSFDGNSILMDLMKDAL
ncbi:hypothetical protein [Sulfitobacter donghicola]|nr:hypothetical protein [Sulfitobacter donghicola]